MSYYFSQQAIDQLKTTFNPYSIKSDLEYCDRTENDIRTYRAACLLRLKELEQITYIWHVELGKSHNYRGKIEFYVSARHVPEVEGGERYAVIPVGEAMRFEGNEKRKDALAMAVNLARKHDCKILLKGGFKLTRKEEADLAPILENPAGVVH